MHRGITFARLGVLALLALAVLVPAATAGSTQLYAKNVAICKTPKHPLTAHAATCDAMKRVFVKAGTAGARPFVPLSTTHPAATIGPAGGLTPHDLVSAYHLATSGGTGQTVAIVDAYNDPNIKADLNTFDSQYGLSCSSCLTVYGQTGSTTSLPANDTSGWSVEESLDVEAVHGICPSCHIDLVEANSTSNSDLAVAENEAAALHATEISNSFGEPEAGTNSTFQAAFNHPRIVITASAGDDGYYDFDWLGGNGTISQPNVPAAYNTVVAVGGTSLYLSQNTSFPTRSYETVWNDNGPQDVYEQSLGSALGAEGGGCSTMFLAKGWQSHKSGYSSAVCGGKRLVSDIAMDADSLTGYDIYDSYACGSACSTTGWLTIGGTSLSAPLVAAAFGLAGGAHGVPYPAVTLYGHSGASYDVTSGGNGICGGEQAAQCPDYNTNGTFDLFAGILDCAYNGSGTASAGAAACDAATGFDGPTGVGTPNGMTLFAKTGPAFSINGPTTATHGVAATWSSTAATDPFPGGTIYSYHWAWGDGTTSTGQNPGSHTYASAGTDTITLTVTDNYGVSMTKTLKVTVS
jgi:PKD repeat protein